MVTRTGILSDKFYEENCVDYRPLPQGMLASLYQGKLGTTPGVKSLINLPRIFEPSTADAFAVTLAAQTGIPAKDILARLRQKIKTYVPTKINVENFQNQQFPDAENQQFPDANQPVLYSRIIRPKLSENISKQIIGSQALLSQKTMELMNFYKTQSTKDKQQINERLIKAFQLEGIEFNQYGGKTIMRGNIATGSETITTGITIVGIPMTLDSDIKNIERGLQILAIKGSTISLDKLFELGKTAESSTQGESSTQSQDELERKMEDFLDSQLKA